MRLGYSADMPTVLRQDGFRVMIRTHDHEPPHVHCFKAGGEVLIDIETGHIRGVDGMNRSDVSKAIALVEENRALLLREWRKMFP